MGTYRRTVLVAVALLGVAAVGCRAGKEAPAPAAPAAPAAARAAPAAPAMPAAPAAPAAPARAGTPGPTSQLLKLIGADPTKAIKVVETRDASGKPAYDVKPGDLLFYTNGSVSYNSTNEKPIVVVIDAKTKKIRAVSEPIDLGSSPHGISVSPDARYVYVPGGPSASGGRGRRVGYWGSFASPLAVLDARTLKLHQIIETGGATHHTHSYQDKYVIFDSFRGPFPIFMLDPSQGNVVVGGIPDGDFQGRPYLAFEDPQGKYLYVSTRPGVARDMHGEEVPGWLTKVDLSDWSIAGTIPTGPGNVWVEFSRDGKFAYVTIGPQSRLQKVDLEKRKVVATAPTGRGPYGSRLAPDEKTIYVASKGEGGTGQKGATFAIIDTQSMGLVNELLACQNPPCQTDHITLSPDGREIWISNNMGSITVYSIEDPRAPKFVTEIMLPGLADTHGGIFVLFDEKGQGRVVADIGGPHGGISPYVWDQQNGRASAYVAGQRLPAPVAAQTRQAAPAAQQPSPSAAIALVQQDFAFSPASVKVKAGSKVQFTVKNDGDAVHNFVNSALGLNEIVINPGQSREVKWTSPAKPGSYLLQCTFHKGMDLTVEVQP